MKGIIKVLNNIIENGKKIQLVIGALCLAMIIITITAGIISRYVFDSPFSWTEELAIFLFVWISFLGANVTAANNKHVVVDLVSEKLNHKARLVMQAINSILILAFLVVLMLGAIKLQPQTAKHFSVTLGIPKNLYYLAPLVSGIYMTLVYVRNFLNTFVNPEEIELGVRSADM